MVAGYYFRRIGKDGEPVERHIDSRHNAKTRTEAGFSTLGKKHPSLERNYHTFGKCK